MPQGTFALFIRRYAPFDTFGGGFEGDKRKGPTTDLKATSRVAHVVVFERSGKIVQEFGHTSGSSHFFLPGGNTDYVPKIYANVLTRVTKVTTASDTVAFTAYSSGSNPLVPGAPPIDTFVDFRAWFCFDNCVIFSGTVRGNDFPHCEVFVWDMAGMAPKSLMLFDFRTAGWATTGPMTKLWGDGATTILGKFERSHALAADGQFSFSSNACAVTNGR